MWRGELGHQSKATAEQATILEGLQADRRSIKQRVEILERDLSQVPKGAGKMIEMLSKGLTELTARVESVEERVQRELETTKPPRRADRQDSDESKLAPTRATCASPGRRSTFLDNWF
jgi:hypothetical protein